MILNWMKKLKRNANTQIADGIVWYVLIKINDTQIKRS